MANRAVPSALKKTQGTFRPDRRRGEPVPPDAPATKPAWVKGLAAKYWKAIIPQLPEGLLTCADTIAMGLLVDALADYLEAREIVEEAAKKDLKFLYTTDKNNLIQHAAKGVQNKAQERVLKLLREFGLTPSSRASIHLGGGDEGDAMAHLLFSKRGNLN